jgi:hypothetical protein
MATSTLNEAVIVQFAGFIILVGPTEPWPRITGIAILIISGIKYRRQRNTLKMLAAPLEPTSKESRSRSGRILAGGSW